MKAAVLVVVGMVGLLGGGCVSATQSAREYAMRDLRCPQERIQAHPVRAGWIVARGCGREAYYYDYSAASAAASGQLGVGHSRTLARR